jgi:DNA primase
MSHDLFSIIREVVNIADVVGKYVSLKPAGSYLKGLSPFQSEKTPSFTVSPAKKIFYCFSTSTGGDVIDFVSRVERCTQLEAAKMLVEQYNIPIPQNILRSHKKKDVENNYYDICSLFAQFCHHYLKQSQEAQTYIASRGINEKTIQKFCLGYCPPELFTVDLFIKKCLEQGIITSDIIKAGIIGERRQVSSHKKVYYFIFEDRIIFPITNAIGAYAGFGGRVFKHTDTRAKYINTNTSSYFSKKDILYGFSIARNDIQKNECVFLVEGYMDAIALDQAGYANVVCSMGTACTTQHILLLERFIKKIIAIYDGDKAGQNALLRLTKMAWSSLIDIAIIQLPEGEDPASLLKKKELDLYIQQQISNIDFFIQFHQKGYANGTLKEKEGHLNGIIECLQSIKNSEKKNITIAHVATKLNMTPDMIYNMVLKNKQEMKPAETTKNINSKIHDAEKNKLDHEWFTFTTFFLIYYQECVKKDIYITFIKTNGPESCQYIIEQLSYFLQKHTDEYNYLSFFDILDMTIKKKLLDYVGKFSFKESHLAIMYYRLQKQVVQENLFNTCRSIEFNNKK